MFFVFLLHLLSVSSALPMNAELLLSYHSTLLVVKELGSKKSNLVFPTESASRWCDLSLKIHASNLLLHSHPSHFAVLAGLDFLESSDARRQMQRQILTLLGRGSQTVSLLGLRPLSTAFRRLQEVTFRWGLALEWLLTKRPDSFSDRYWVSAPSESDVEAILVSLEHRFPIITDCEGYDKTRFENRQQLLGSISKVDVGLGDGVTSPRASRRVAVPMWSSSRTLLSARELCAAVAKGEALLLAEQFRIPPQKFDTLSTGDAIAAVMKGLPMPLVSSDTDPLTFPPLQPIVAMLATMRAGTAGRSSLSYGQASLVGMFPPILTPDGKHLSTEFVSGILRHRPVPISHDDDAVRSRPSPSLRQPQDPSASSADASALEASLMTMLRFLCKVLHFVHDRFPMPQFYGMLPILNDALRIFHLLGLDISAIAAIALRCGDPLGSSITLPNTKVLFGDADQRRDGETSHDLSGLGCEVHPICFQASKAVFLLCACFQRLQDKVRGIVEASVLAYYSNGEAVVAAAKSISSAHGSCQTFVNNFALRATQSAITRDGDSDDDEGFDAAGQARYNRNAIRKEDATLTLPSEGTGLGAALVASLLHPLVALCAILPDAGAAVVTKRGTRGDFGDASISMMHIPTALEDSPKGRNTASGVVAVHQRAASRLHVALLSFAHLAIQQELANVVLFRAPSFMNVYSGVGALVIKGDPEKMKAQFKGRPTSPKPFRNGADHGKIDEVAWAAIVMSDRRTVERFTDSNPHIPLEIKELLLR